MKSKLAATLLFAFPLATTGFGVEPTPAELAKIKSDIDALEVLLSGGQEKNNLRALGVIQGAMGSPKDALALYLEAKKDVDFLKLGKKEADFREWRDRDDERLRSTEFQVALQYQLRYLALFLQATSGEDATKTLGMAMPKVIGYLDDLGGVYENLEGHKSVLKRSVLKSAVARQLKLDITANQDTRMAVVPGDVPQIYEQTILPHYRDAKDSAGLQSAWDKRIAQEAKMLDWSDSESQEGPPERRGDIEARLREMFERGGGRRRFGGDEREREREEKREDSRLQEEKEEQFKEERLPELLWGKYRDGYLFGGAKALALGKMSSHVRANLSHPQASSWLEELKALVEGGGGETAEPAAGL